MKAHRLALYFSLFILVVILAVSFTHLAHGIAMTTGISLWESWAMAVAIDAGMIAAEYAALVDKPTRYTRYSVILGLILSGMFNCIAFTAAPLARAAVLYVCIGIVLGVLVPTSMYALAQTAHTLRKPQPRVPSYGKRRAKVAVLKAAKYG
ncbi:MAG: DUF2637 domain-containing protein [Candidatus Binatia bacterium]